jgi:hypothetical protein
MKTPPNENTEERKTNEKRSKNKELERTVLNDYPHSS